MKTMNPPKVHGIAGVYVYVDLDNGKPYVGQAHDLLGRHIGHISNKKPAKNSIDEAIKAKGIEHFTYRWIELTGDIDKDLDTIERTIIKLLDAYNNGYNKTKGNGSKTEDYITQYTVRAKFISIIRGEFGISFFGKRILLVGNYEREFYHCLEKYENCDVVRIDNFYCKEESELFFKDLKERLNAMQNKDFDIIISNPPYGKIGNQITKTLLNNIKFEYFVNLLPANDYHLTEKANKLWQYVDINNFKTVRGGFSNAAVTTHIALLKKIPDRTLTEEFFELKSYQKNDPQMDIFFVENRLRKFDAFENASSGGFKYKPSDFWDIDKTIIIGKRDVNHMHMPYTKDCVTYKWNVEKSIDYNYIKSKKVDKNGQYTVSNIEFNSTLERDNFIKFMYSEDGFRFISKIFKAVMVDSSIHFTKILPKVDWTKEWTVEEILKDYGYTNKEIKEVMDNLKNFRGMNE